VDCTPRYCVQVRLPRSFINIYNGNASWGVCYVGAFGLGYFVLAEVRPGTACRWMAGGVTP